MTPETLRIDRTFKGVGRIARATGTTNPALRRKISRLLTALADEGRIDILRALRDGKLDFLSVYEASQRKTLHELATGETLRPLAVTMKEWIDGLLVPRDVSKKHAESLETSRRYFERADPKATVNDLPRLLDALRSTLGMKHPRSFNLARAAALAFVRATLKKSHPLWLHISAVEPRKLAKVTERRPLSPEHMRNLFPHPETDAVDGIAWGMATTGMGAGEYWGTWHVMADRIHIEGTKREGRVRDIPLVRSPAVPAMHRRTWEDKVRERTRTITAYDFRRTYANWLESAGIPRTRRKLYLGHGSADVTDLYERHEVTAFLVEDAAKLRDFVGVPTESHTITLHKAGGAQ